METSRLLTRAVTEFARRTRFPVAFGGLLDDAGVARVTNIVGNRTTALRGLAVAPERGLGGRALAELRPRMTGDYGTARQITHDYDAYVLGEGIGTLMAVPVLVDGRPRGILYGGTWGVWNVGGVTAAPAVKVAEELGRRLSETASEPRDPEPLESAPLSPRAQEELRESYAELRTIAAAIDDDRLRARLANVEQRLAALTTTGSTAKSDSGIRLSRRETDVLACAGLGSTNAQIAAQLGLREGTVKAYLGTAMSKLDASTRHAAVAAARRRGLLP